MILSIISIVLNFAGALGLLLFGMDMLSAGIQKGAGKSLQKLLGMISSNRFTAVLTGVLVTAIIQSSGATTVMVVSFVNAEILSLTQAIGIIFGANIGTTVTAWIVSLFGFNFSISSVAIPIFGIGFAMKFLKKWKVHNYADVFMGFGLLFWGLDLLKGTLSLDAGSMIFLQKFAGLGIWGIIVSVIIGAVLTALVHSSSAITAIVITLATLNADCFPWEIAAALVLGSNIGSTVDAVLSAMGANINAKRTAVVHVGFNVLGTVIALILFRPFLSLVDFIIPGLPKDNMSAHIAMLHTVFNVCATILFLPFVNQIAGLVTKIVKESGKYDDEHYRLPAITPVMHSSVDLYTVQMEREIGRMAGHVMIMLDEVAACLSNHNKKSVEEIKAFVSSQENYVDEMNEAITPFLVKCTRMSSANHDNRVQLSKMMQITDGLESLSDECCAVMHTVAKYIGSKGLDIKSESFAKIVSYMNQVHDFFEYVSQHIVLGLTEGELEFSSSIEEEIDRTQKVLKKMSRKRIESGENVKTELQYIDIVRRIEKAGDCIYGIAKVL